MPQPLLGDRSVLLLGGREHLRQRRLLPPPFHGEWMQAYAETMRKVAERQVAAWPRGRSFAVGPSMQAITLEVILRTVFGINGEERVESVGAPLRRLLDATASQPRLFALQVTSSEDPHRLSPWGRFKTLVAEADRVVYEELAARRAEPGDGGHEDVLSLLLAARDDEGQSLTDLELRDELMTLLLAGHETTATALSWTLERLVRHPIVLDHLLAEHRAGDTAYLDAVIKESLRLRPAAASSRKPPPTGRKVAYMATFRPTDRKDGLVGAALVPRGMSAVEAWLREREVDRSQLEPRTLTHARIGRLLRGAPLSAARAAEPSFRRRMGAIFDRADLVLTPTTAEPPPPVDHLRDRGYWGTSTAASAACPFAWPWNVVGWPAISVPAGFTATGLPIGAQLVAPADGEALLLSLAAQLEQVRRWHEQLPPEAR